MTHPSRCQKNLKEDQMHSFLSYTPHRSHRTIPSLLFFVSCQYLPNSRKVFLVGHVIYPTFWLSFSRVLAFHVLVYSRRHRFISPQMWIWLPLIAQAFVPICCAGLRVAPHLFRLMDRRLRYSSVFHRGISTALTTSHFRLHLLMTAMFCMLLQLIGQQ